MKKLLSTLLPEALKSKWRKSRSRFKNKTTKAVFEEIYTTGYWKNDSETSISGPGSTGEATQLAQKALPAAIAYTKATSIADIGCGDFGWMQDLNWQETHYTGYDIVPQLVESNTQTHGSNNIAFALLDIVESSPEKADLVLCRDCMVHLNLAAAQKALDNIKKSGARYVLMTHFPKCTLNKDIATGNWREINWNLPPFNLPKPEKEWVDIFEGKSLALWELNPST